MQRPIWYIKPVIYYIIFMYLRIMDSSVKYPIVKPNSVWCVHINFGANVFAGFYVASSLERKEKSVWRKCAYWMTATLIDNHNQKIRLAQIFRVDVVRQDETHWSITPQFHNEVLGPAAIRNQTRLQIRWRTYEDTERNRNQTIAWLLLIMAQCIGGWQQWQCARF